MKRLFGSFLLVGLLLGIGYADINVTFKKYVKTLNQNDDITSSDVVLYLTDGENELNWLYHLSGEEINAVGISEDALIPILARETDLAKTHFEETYPAPQKHVIFESDKLVDYKFGADGTGKTTVLKEKPADKIPTAQPEEIPQ